MNNKVLALNYLLAYSSDYMILAWYEDMTRDLVDALDIIQYYQDSFEEKPFAILGEEAVIAAMKNRFKTNGNLIDNLAREMDK